MSGAGRARETRGEHALSHRDEVLKSLDNIHSLLEEVAVSRSAQAGREYQLPKLDSTGIRFGEAAMRRLDINPSRSPFHTREVNRLPEEPPELAREWRQSIDKVLGNLYREVQAGRIQARRVYEHLHSWMEDFGALVPFFENPPQPKTMAAEELEQRLLDIAVEAEVARELAAAVAKELGPDTLVIAAIDALGAVKLCTVDLATTYVERSVQELISYNSERAILPVWWAGDGRVGAYFTTSGRIFAFLSPEDVAYVRTSWWLGPILDSRADPGTRSPSPKEHPDD